MTNDALEMGEQLVSQKIDSMILQGVKAENAFTMK